jgi:hypothetical protein
MKIGEAYQRNGEMARKWQYRNNHGEMASKSGKNIENGGISISGNGERQHGVNKRSGNQWRHQRAWHGGSMARKNENSVMASAWRNEK